MNDMPPPKPAVRDRTSVAARLSGARLAAVQALYQMEIAGGEIGDVVAQFLAGGTAEEDTAFETDPKLFETLVRGVGDRQDELDGLLSEALATDWPLARLEVILRCILRVGVCELTLRPDVPAKVIISEHIELAHAFFEGAEPGMVNGVLDRLARRLRPGELGEENGDRKTPSR